MHPHHHLQEPLSFKGVVFNEMKGVYSSPDSVFYRAVQQVGRVGEGVAERRGLVRQGCVAPCACEEGGGGRAPDGTGARSTARACSEHRPHTSRTQASQPNPSAIPIPLSPGPGLLRLFPLLVTVPGQHVPLRQRRRPGADS